MAALKDILNVHIQRSVWADAAPEHSAPLGGCPDISAYKLLAKQYSTDRLNRHSYYLNAIVQGAMEAHSLNHFKHETSNNEIICNHCHQQIGDVILWEHLALTCRPVRDLLSTDAIALELELAAFETRQCKWRSAYWLRGLMQPFEQDLLNLTYEYTSTFSGTLDEHGCILGGDGSGGQNSRDPKTRRCGFGLAFISANDSYDSASYNPCGGRG